jgi:hypothetical protein
MPMKKPDPTEQALDRLGVLRSEADLSAAARQELGAFLKNRSNLVVAKAAKIAGERRVTGLIDDLVSAFRRLMEKPQKLDKGCAATTEIVGTLYQMDYVETEIYLLGIHHVQMEGSFGPPVDAAAKLRAFSALGLARTRHPRALEEIVPLLVDPWPQARIGAVRALASNGGHAGALLLRLKVLTGESDLDVLAECFSGLLASAPESSLPLVAAYIDAEDEAVAEVALLAIGSSRLPEALTLLQGRCEASTFASLRKPLLLAIAMVRSEAAIEFLISLLADSGGQTAKDIITALAIFRDNSKVRLAVEQAVLALNDKALSEAFRREF